jgi:hypothetical protein
LVSELFLKHNAPSPTNSIKFFLSLYETTLLQGHPGRGADFLLVPVKIHAYAIAHKANAKSPRRYCMGCGKMGTMGEGYIVM